MDNLYDSEVYKYERMWACPEYRAYSPGAAAVPLFTEHFTKRGTIVDLGCGTGRAGFDLVRQGWDVTFLDFVYTLDHFVPAGKFVVGCLWDLPPTVYDYIYCVDVLEHVPPSKVEDCLRGMSRIMKKGGYLQIALQPDSCGQLINEVLHLTLMSYNVWHIEISRYFKIVRDLTSDNNYAKFIVGGKDGQTSK